MKLPAIKKFVLDILFPINCLSCGKELGEFICQECLNKFPVLTSQSCFCGKRLPAGKICESCRKETRISRLMYASYYDNKIIRELIHIFKYKRIENLSLPLGEILIKFLEKQIKLGLDLSGFKIIPIPIYKSRFIERGFNQSELLANGVGKYFGLEVSAKILKRIKNTPPQAEIDNWEKRKENIIDVFLAVRPELTANQKIILLDDVSTSGATLKEAAKILKEAGAKKIYGLILARG